MGDQVKKTRQVTAVIEREGDGYVALCPELDMASQGETVEEARTNLVEAVELFLETADPTEIRGHNLLVHLATAKKYTK